MTPLRDVNMGSAPIRTIKVHPNPHPNPTPTHNPHHPHHHLTLTPHPHPHPNTLTQVHEHPRPKLCELYESDCILTSSSAGGGTTARTCVRARTTTGSSYGMSTARAPALESVSNSPGRRTSLKGKLGLSRTAPRNGTSIRRSCITATTLQEPRRHRCSQQPIHFRCGDMISEAAGFLHGRLDRSGIGRRERGWLKRLRAPPPPNYVLLLAVWSI